LSSRNALLLKIFLEKILVTCVELSSCLYSGRRRTFLMATLSPVRLFLAALFTHQG
jgi:hypothetical protein